MIIPNPWSLLYLGMGEGEWDWDGSFISSGREWQLEAMLQNVTSSYACDWNAVLVTFIILFCIF